MGDYGIIIMWVFAAIGFAILNNGPKDKEYRRRESYWARFEDGKSSGSSAVSQSNRVMAGKKINIAGLQDPIKVQKMVTRFAAMSDAANSDSAAASPALTVLTSFSSGNSTSDNILQSVRGRYFQF